MREFNALAGYPASTSPRVASRTMKNRLVASEGGREFFDGARENGYGGLRDDGRWAAVAARMAAHYDLLSESAAFGVGDTASVLEIQCEKGYLLREFFRLGLNVRGTETRAYAIANCAVPAVWAEPMALPFDAETFDLVIARGAVYTLTDADAVRCLREIERVGKGRSFVLLGAYDGAEDRALFERWSLLGIPRRRSEWRDIMAHVGYRGDYHFVTAESLNLVAGPQGNGAGQAEPQELLELP